ncbi:MAG: hypothetical protein WD042_12945 [Phycisphaeraceae bacterium]
MVILALIPAILSCLLLAAHFYRMQGFVLAGICVAAPFVLLVQRWWAVRVMQVVLALGAAEWFFTIANIYVERVQEGRPWLRMAIILGAVTLFTLGAAILFKVAPLRRRYGTPR